MSTPHWYFPSTQTKAVQCNLWSHFGIKTCSVNDSFTDVIKKADLESKQVNAVLDVQACVQQLVALEKLSFPCA